MESKEAGNTAEIAVLPSAPEEESAKPTVSSILSEKTTVHSLANDRVPVVKDMTMTTVANGYLNLMKRNLIGVGGFLHPRKATVVPWN